MELYSTAKQSNQSSLLKQAYHLLLNENLYYNHLFWLFSAIEQNTRLLLDLQILQYQNKWTRKSTRIIILLVVKVKKEEFCIKICKLGRGAQLYNFTISWSSHIEVFLNFFWIFSLENNIYKRKYRKLVTLLTFRNNLCDFIIYIEFTM